MRTVLMLLLCVLLGACSGARVRPPADSADARVHSVRAFVAAFNAGNANGMAALASEHIEWLSVDGSSVHLESRGRAELLSEMNDYFRGCPSCRARIDQVLAGPERVVTLETAYWQAEGALHQQSSVAVYEFDGERIRRVHYFPVEGATSPGSRGCTRRPC